MRVEAVALATELLGDLRREVGVEAARSVNRGELGQLTLRIVGELPLLEGDVGFLRVSLRAHRYVFSRRHRQRARDEPGDAREEHRPDGRCR